MDVTTVVVVSVITMAVAGAGAALTDLGPWYRDLRKPSWQPPDWLFGPAWTVILSMAALSAVLGWQAAPTAEARSSVLALFVANAILHVLWNPLFFKFRRPDWALFEVVFLWLSILALIVVMRPFSPAASGLLVPYLLWVMFAAYLNLTIVRLNAPFRTRTNPLDART
jgi:translocator protein